MKSWMPAKVATRAQVSTSSKTAIDFDAEGRALWEKLNLDSSNKGGKELSPIDPIFKHPIGGGTIYVGGSRAAKNLKTLRDNNITSVVNCTYALVHKAGGKVRSKKSSKLITLHLKVLVESGLLGSTLCSTGILLIMC